MSLSSRTIAVQGIGYGARSMAFQGLFSESGSEDIPSLIDVRSVSNPKHSTIAMESSQLGRYGYYFLGNGRHGVRSR